MIKHGIRGVIVVCVTMVLFSCALRSRSTATGGQQGATSYHPPAAEEWKLANGLTVLFLPNPELPMVTATLYIRGGSLWEREEKPGVVSAMGVLMRQGGAGNLSADQLDKKLDQLSASISTGFGDEFGVLGFDCLSSDLDQIFPIFSDIVQRPRFEHERLMLWRGMALEEVRRRRDDAGTVATIAFNQILFGGTPYAKIPGVRDIKGIGRGDLIAAHQDFVHPDGGFLVVSGDISRPRLETLIASNFSDWAARGYTVPAPPPINTEVQTGIYFIQMPFEQSTVVMGHRGVPRLTPDMIAIEGFNKIFGSLGFGSRLMNRIRSDLGLVYGISGSISPGIVQGENTIFLQTKAGTTGQAIVESVKILGSMQQGPILDSEMTLMRDTSVNSFVFKFDSAQELVQRYALLRLLGYPEDYDLQYIPRISALKPEDIQSVARNRWDLDKFVYVVVGNETAYHSLVAAREKEQSPLASVRLIKAGFTDRLEIPNEGAQ